MALTRVKIAAIWRDERRSVLVQDASSVGAFSRQTPSARSGNAFDVGFRKIIAYMQQGAGVLLRGLLGEAISEIQGGRVRALSPPLISLGGAPRRGRRDRRHVKAEAVDQARHLRADLPPRRDDERFGHGDGKNQDILLGFQRGDAGVGLRLVEDDRQRTKPLGPRGVFARST